MTDDQLLVLALGVSAVFVGIGFAALLFGPHWLWKLQQKRRGGMLR